MKNKLIVFGSYFFGAIATVVTGVILGSPGVPTIPYFVVLVSSVVALRLYWMQPN